MNIFEKQRTLSRPCLLLKLQKSVWIQLQPQNENMWMYHNLIIMINKSPWRQNNVILNAMKSW